MIYYYNLVKRDIMEIKEITADEFKKFNNKFNIHSTYQTPEYGFIMQKQGFESVFVGLIDNNNILAASLILIEKRKGFKYAYAPRGFLINYNDFKLLDVFTQKIKKFLSKKGVTAIKSVLLLLKILMT